MTSDIPTRPEPGAVIAGVDGSPSAGTAALWAAAEADRRGGTLPTRPTRPPRAG
ncbi:hypothetical protein ACFVGW_09060 [Streptomyces sp. NPDC127129]|uniref:hypothetical protein n=1 Tax=Streptomyces sp. NPDC127129 TaxID=3345373 RepID=UPI003628A4A4